MADTDIARSASFCRSRDDLSIIKRLSGSGVKRDYSCLLAISAANGSTTTMPQSS